MPGRQYATVPWFKAHFQSPKILGRHSPQTISTVGRNHCGWKDAGSRGRQAENFALLDKIRKKYYSWSWLIWFMFPVVSEREWAVKSKFDICQQATLPKLEAHFQSPNVLGTAEPQTISACGRGGRKIIRWSRGRPAANFRYWTNYTFCVSFIVYQYSL